MKVIIEERQAEIERKAALIEQTQQWQLHLKQVLLQEPEKLTWNK